MKSGWIAHKGSALEFLVQASVMKRATCDDGAGRTMSDVNIADVIMAVTMYTVIWCVALCSLVCTVP